MDLMISMEKELDMNVGDIMFKQQQQQQQEEQQQRQQRQQRQQQQQQKLFMVCNP